MSEPQKSKVFCGMLASGGAMAICAFVMGKLDGVQLEETNKIRAQLGMPMATLSDLFKPGFLGSIYLTSPVLIHRVLGQDQHTKELKVTHQYIDDPFWYCEREGAVPFNLSHFVTARFFDEEKLKDAQEIMTYENGLQARFATKSGIHLSK